MIKMRQGLVLLTLMGLSLQTVGFSAFLPVCNRTPAVKVFLEEELKKSCENITETDLLLVKRVAPESAGVKVFLKDDFSGLKNLEILNIRSNPFTELPEGMFDDLGNLRTLVIISTPLRHYPDDFLEKTPLIEDLNTFRNQVKSLSESVFVRLRGLKHLKVLDFDKKILAAEKKRLREIFPEKGPVQLNFY